MVQQERTKHWISQNSKFFDNHLGKRWNYRTTPCKELQGDQNLCSKVIIISFTTNQPGGKSIFVQRLQSKPWTDDIVLMKKNLNKITMVSHWWWKLKSKYRWCWKNCVDFDGWSSGHLDHPALDLQVCVFFFHSVSTFLVTPRDVARPRTA